MEALIDTTSMNSTKFRNEKHFRTLVVAQLVFVSLSTKFITCLVHFAPSFIRSSLPTSKLPHLPHHFFALCLSTSFYIPSPLVDSLLVHPSVNISIFDIDFPKSIQLACFLSRFTIISSSVIGVYHLCQYEKKTGFLVLLTNL